MGAFADTASQASSIGKQAVMDIFVTKLAVAGIIYCDNTRLSVPFLSEHVTLTHSHLLKIGLQISLFCYRVEQLSTTIRIVALGVTWALRRL